MQLGEHDNSYHLMEQVQTICFDLCSNQHRLTVSVFLGEGLFTSSLGIT